MAEVQAVAEQAAGGNSMDSKQLGIFGEKTAEKYLKEKGYRILDKNYIPRFVSGPMRAEIDIIAKKADTIIFIEVKTAANSGFCFAPEDRVNFAKQRKILKAAENWLMEKKILLESKWQVDVVAVELDTQTQKAKIRHFQNCVT